MKKINYIVVFIITFLLSGFTSNVKAQPTIQLDVSPSKNVVVGSSVIITVKTSEIAGTYSLISSNNSVLSGGTSRANIASYGGSATWTFKANSAGTATITFSTIDMASSSEQEFSQSKSVTVTVRNKQVVVLSSDSSLSSLGVENATLSPEFSSGTTEYSVSLEPDTTSINVIASANHGGASISGAGTREVTDGDNRIEVVVTAENGTSTTYVINANVKEYDPITVKISNKDYTVVRKKSSLTPPNNYQEATIMIGENEVPAFKSEITNLTLVGLKDENGTVNLYVYENDKYILYKEYSFNGITLYPIEYKDYPTNYKKVEITYNDEKINVYKTKASSNYALIYGMNVETGEKNIYMYDSKEDTLQIYNREEINSLEEQNTLYLKTIIGLGILSVVLVIITIVVAIKKRKPSPSNDEK